jgi:c-di-GMP-related signal transduction protein
MTHTHDVFLARQPILDRDQNQVAYELLFRSGHHAEARVTDGQQATATVICNAFSHLSLSAALGPYRGFVNVDKTFLHDDAIQLMPVDKVVIEVLEGSEVTPEVVTRCADLKAMGYTIALDDFSRITSDYVPLLPLADIIKVDLTLVSQEELPALVEQLRPLVPQLLAEKVETLEQFDLCRSLGFDLFQGYYFAHPVILSGRRLLPVQATTLRLISQIARDEETSIIERTLKEDSALSVSLLRLVNSVAAGTCSHISSMRQAIIVLGRQQISRWLQLLLYANPNSTGVSPLLIMAALRGRFSELVAERTSKKDHGLKDAAYMAGILSLTPTLLGQPLEEILPALNLAPPIEDALLHGKGVLGAILEMSQEVEAGSVPTCQDCLHRLPQMDTDQLNACHAEALAWANQIGIESGI